MVALVSQENVVTLVSRTGRELQRYRKGRRQVVGCIPYRFKIGEKNSLDVLDELEVLVISSQKGKGMLFPKGGWELDESQKEAALRETIEEAGVRGIVEMSIKEARDVCQHWWMKEALDRLVNRLMGQKLGRENQILRPLNCIGDAKSDLLIV
ncbi:hypothetical protein TSUD_123020 [Trifolium subterraneum]|uniref:Nudix hydrolase domain-containing protein n=1 Tax=Trifolium subterraneum TaxID=3900 RepID=A0A2Z6MH46_TRISU|nr:hypothetical protein TSUD_123020 [Trifolium subterraneum]